MSRSWLPPSVLFLIIQRRLRWILALLLCQYAAFVTFSAGSDGSDLSALDNLGATTLVVGPLAAASTTWLIRSDYGYLSSFLPTRSQRRRRSGLGIAVTMTLLIASIHLISLLILLGLRHDDSATLSTPWLAQWSVPLLYMCGLVGIGLVGGINIQKPYAPAIVGGLVFLIPVLSPLLGIESLISLPGGSTIPPSTSEIPLSPRPAVLIAQMVLATAITIAGYMAVNHPPSRTVITKPTGLFILIAVLSAGFLQSFTDSRFDAVDRAISTNCETGAVELCLGNSLRPHREMLTMFFSSINSELSTQEAQPRILEVHQVSFGHLFQAGAQSADNVRWLFQVPIYSPSANPAEYLAMYPSQWLFPPKCFGSSTEPTAFDEEGTTDFAFYLLKIGLAGITEINLEESSFTTPTQASKEWVQQSWAAVTSCQSPEPLAQ